MKEGLTFDRKSIKSVTGNTANFKELAKDCVAFANVRGGEIHIGIEDKEMLPCKEQRVEEELPGVIAKRINELTMNVGISPRIVTAENGGEFIILTVYPSESSVASTTKGEYIVRDGDKSRPVYPDELSRLFTDKSSYSWETKVTIKVKWQDCDRIKLRAFTQDIRDSEPKRVSDFIKEKSDYELLEYYLMVDSDGYLTNLGILWVGKREQRARVLYTPSVQYIKYDSDGEKVDKVVWDDYELNPKELIEAIWTRIPDWRESYEISEGLWRKQIPAYDERVVREVLCNALAHRPYTMRGDIFINIHPDRMEVVNPGRLPLGVTSENILQKTIQRNEHLSRVLFALELIEKEGSGYDLMYETLLSSGKMVPDAYEGDDFVKVTIYRKIINNEIVRLFEHIKDNYNIPRKGMIAVGIIVQSKKISALDLTRKLQLSDKERLRSYVSAIVDKGIVTTSGQGKGVNYCINPKLLANAKANIQTTLKTIEPHRLKALIIEDLSIYPNSLISEISRRLPDVDYKDLERTIRLLAKTGILTVTGGRKFRRYRNNE